MHFVNLNSHILLRQIINWEKQKTFPPNTQSAFKIMLVSKGSLSQTFLSAICKFKFVNKREDKFKITKTLRIHQEILLYVHSVNMSSFDLLVLVILYEYVY